MLSTPAFPASADSQVDSSANHASIAAAATPPPATPRRQQWQHATDDHFVNRPFFEDTLEPPGGPTAEDPADEYEDPFSGWVMATVRDERTGVPVGARPVRPISPRPLMDVEVAVADSSPSFGWVWAIFAAAFGIALLGARLFLTR